LQEDIKKQIDDFNQKLEDALDDANFQVDGDGNYTSMYLNDIECPDDTNSGMAPEEENVPSLEEYDDMVMEECPGIPSKNLGIPKIGKKKCTSSQIPFFTYKPLTKFGFEACQIWIIQTHPNSSELPNLVTQRKLKKPNLAINLEVR
jgi:hypothetical protein